MSVIMLSQSIFSVILRVAVFIPVARGIRILPSEAARRREEWQRQEESTNDSNHRKLHKNVHVDVPSNPDGHLVKDLPLLDDFPTQQWAGHLPASAGGDKYFFYWLFAPDLTQHPDLHESDVPLIIWLNGGPACSSMDGLFIENGPFRLRVDPESNHFRIVVDPYSWHSQAPAYTLYIDQPVGTGLSFTTSAKYPTNDLEVNTDFYYFLQQFMALHADKFVSDDKKLNRDLFFSGESYAGHYIPSLMNYLLKQKDAGGSDKIEIGVAGAAIGNGWTDPFYQYAGADFAYGEGLIGLPEVERFKEKEKDCQRQLNAGHYNVGVCFDLIDDILHESHGGKSDTKASSYDVRKSESKHGSRNFPPGHKVVETYLGGWKLPDDENGVLDENLYTTVLDAVHASSATAAGQRYRECTDPPYNALAGNDGKGVVDDVVQILEHPDNVQLLFFNGIHDIICNHVGNEVFLQKLPWEYASDWTMAERYAWFAANGEPGKVSGYMKEHKNLRFLKIMDAGHMVPMDVPHVAAEMMKLFVSGGSFDTSLQALDKAEEQDNCPVCPTCLERDSAHPTTSDGSSTVDKFALAMAWVGVGAAFAVCFVGIVLFRRRRIRPMRASTVPQYDIELRDSSSYRDQPNGVNGHDEEENRVV